MKTMALCCAAAIMARASPAFAQVGHMPGMHMPMPAKTPVRAKAAAKKKTAKK